MLVVKGKKRYICWGIGKKWVEEKKKSRKKNKRWVNWYMSYVHEIYKNKNYNCVSTQQIITISFTTVEVSNISYVKRKFNKLIKYYIRIDHN